MTGGKVGFEPATLARSRLRLTSCTARPHSVSHTQYNTVTVVADHRTKLLCFVPLHTENNLTSERASPLS